MITLVDHGLFNPLSLQGALDRIGKPWCLAASPTEAAHAGPILLVASAAFDGIQLELKQRGWWRELPQFVAAGRPLLAMDAGLHLLLEGSEESPRGSGLGLLPGLARRLGPGVKVPHIGWAPVQQLREHPCLPDPRGGWLHFAHCHAVEPDPETLLVAQHGRAFSVAEARGRVVGIQARLDKSGSLGLVLLQHVLEWMGETSGEATGRTVQ